MGERKWYSDEDLNMFKNLIEKKLQKAEELLLEQKGIMTGAHGNGTNDTSWSFKADDNPEYSTKQEAAILAHNQEVFISSCRKALIRIENKTYGICIQTGELIDRNRFLAVPHTTTCLVGKNMQKAEIPPTETFENF